MDFDWKKTVAAVAPMLGMAIGGPFGTMATGVITAALGLSENSTEDQIAEAVKRATPEQLLSLKKADQDFKKGMRELDIKEEQLHADDRDSARRREVSLGGDRVVKGIAIYTAFAFSVMIGWLIWKGAPDNLDKTILGMLIGYAASKAEQVYNYYFGSSKGSSDKTFHLTNKNK